MVLQRRVLEARVANAKTSPNETEILKILTEETVYSNGTRWVPQVRLGFVKWMMMLKLGSAKLFVRHES